MLASSLVSRNATVATIIAVSWLVFIAAQLRTWKPDSIDADAVVADRRSHTVFALATVCGMAVAWVLAYVDVAVLPVQPAVVAIGMVMMWAALALRIWARRTLGEFFDPKVTIRSTHVLVDRGPYRLLRHPIYLSYLLCYSGLGVALGTILTVAACSIPTIAALAYRVHVEEAELAGHFGDAWSAYANGRARVIPWLW